MYIWQVQKHLQLRIEAQGKYMQSILEKAYNTLAGENNMAAAASTNFNKGNIGTQGMGAMKELIGSPLSFLPFQDLNINYGSSSGGEQQLDHEFMPTNNNENLFVEKKRPNPYSTGKSPLMSGTIMMIWELLQHHALILLALHLKVMMMTRFKLHHQQYWMEGMNMIP